jgi:hypothetical protein
MKWEKHGPTANTGNRGMANDKSDSFVRKLRKISGKTKIGGGGFLFFLARDRRSPEARHRQGKMGGSAVCN